MTGVGQEHHHRSSFKQSNKSFKSGHASKRTLRNAAKGKIEKQRVEKGAHKVKLSTEECRANRKNAAKIALQNKRDLLANAQRMFLGKNGVPKVAAIIPLCPDHSPSDTLRGLFSQMDQEYAENYSPSALLQYVHLIAISESSPNFLTIFNFSLERSSIKKYYF
jgi:pre-rRNA-processing protein TSR1